MPDASVVAQLSALPGVRTASGVAEEAGDARIAGEALPVASELAGVLPWGGLRRGSTLAVHGSTSLLLALLAEATSAGSWAAVVGMPNLGVVAASELGVRVDRLALVPHPGAEFASVASALLDGMDLVAVAAPGERTGGQVRRRLSARARHRRSVLLSMGPWPGADVELRYAAGRWSGMSDGAGYLCAREAAVHATGRGAAARPVRAELALPSIGGGISPGEVPRGLLQDRYAEGKTAPERAHGDSPAIAAAGRPTSEEGHLRGQSRPDDSIAVARKSQQAPTRVPKPGPGEEFEVVREVG